VKILAFASCTSCSFNPLARLIVLTQIFTIYLNFKQPHQHCIQKNKIKVASHEIAENMSKKIKMQWKN
jgi:carbamate kinase